MDRACRERDPAADARGVPAGEVAGAGRAASRSLALLAIRIAVHAVTLPVELDASFGKALPALTRGRYLIAGDLPAARSVLQAAAYTYVAAALIDVRRWLKVLRF